MSVTRIGRYEVRAQLARSPASVVYEGWDSAIGRKVAIKIVPVADKHDPETKESLLRFAHGARASGTLNHPNIVAVHDYGETNDCAYLVMEFVQGRTLKALLDSVGHLPPSDILRIMEDVLAGLAHSHEHGIIHRDVKPANIMVLANGRAKVTDFGVARIESASITQAGTIIGTPAYMSPEQFLGEPVDPRSDIYSAGVVLYHMLTGRRPYEGSVATIAHKVLNSEPPPPSQVAVGFAPAFDAIVRRAMARNRDQRYASAQEFARAIRGAVQVAAPEPTVATRAAAALHPLLPRAGPSRSGGGGRIAAIAAVIAGLVAGGAIGAVMFWRHAAPPASAPATLPASPTKLASAPPPLPPAQVVAPSPPADPMPPPTPPSTPAGLENPKPVAPDLGIGREVAPRAEALAALVRPVVPPPPRRPPPSHQPAAAARGVDAAPSAFPAVTPVEQSPPDKPAVPAERRRVFIYYPRGSNAALELTTLLAQRMLFSDFAYADTRAASNGPGSAEIRFFHPQDAEAASRLVALLGGTGPDFEVRNWSGDQRAEPPGTLEVWLGR